MHGLLLLRVMLLCERELLTRCRCAQYDNQIVDLQGVQFPSGLQELSLVSLRTAAAAVWSVFVFVLMFCVKDYFFFSKLLICISLIGSYQMQYQVPRMLWGHIQYYFVA
jgi:hypothetical protein